MSNLIDPRAPGPRHPPRRSLLPPSQDVLSGLVADWVADGIITPEQASRMLERQGQGTPDVGPSTRPSRALLSVEALGYLGGVIVLVSTMLIAAQYWSEITTAWRLLVVGATATALLACGFAVPEHLRDVGVRLRAALWLASTAAVAGLLAVIGTDVLTMTDADAVLLVAVGTTAFASVLWYLHPSIAQQVAMMVASMTVAGAAIADFVTSDALPGVGVWGVGVIWLQLGWGGLLLPRRVAMALGAAGTVLGAMITMSNDAGIVFAIITAAGVVVAALLFHDLALLAVGVLATVQVLPAALTRWFPDRMAAPFALLGVGAVLVGAALWIARRRVRHPGRARASRDYSIGQPGAALRAGGSVFVAVLVFVVVVALA